MRGALRVSARCAVAGRLGVAVGMPLAEAIAIAGDEAVTQPHDRAADLDALQKLAIRCRAFSPVCGIEPTDDRGCTETGQPAECVLLDLHGCTHLFGTDRAVAEAAVQTVARFGLAARAGVGPTVGLAWAAARAATAERPCVIDAAGAIAWLDRQPVAALRLPAETLDGLAGFDLRRVGALRQLPRQSLPSRFGDVLLRRFDQADGTTPEPVRPLLPPERLSRQWVGEHPVRSPTLAGEIAQRLAGELVEGLPSGLGLLELTATFGDGGDATQVATQVATKVAVRLAGPTRETVRVARLLDLKLERTPLPREITRVEVAAGGLASLAESPVDLFGQPVDAGDSLGRLLETLGGRLGTERVCRPKPTGETLPERAVRWVPAIGDAPAASPIATNATALNATALNATTATGAASRPILLVDPPRRVDVQADAESQPVRIQRRQRKRRQVDDVAHAWGPERIETGWWLDDDEHGCGERRRDYWRAQLASGACLWLFRDLWTGDWFHHGTF